MVLWRKISAASLPLFPEGGKDKKKKRVRWWGSGSVAEWSKVLDLGSSLSGGVGSNPTASSSGFNQGREALRVLEKSLKYCESTFPWQCLQNNMPRTFPQPIACLLRQGDSVLLLGEPVLPLWFTDYLYCLLMIWVNPVLICSSKLIVDLLWQQHSHKRNPLGIRFVLRKQD